MTMAVSGHVVVGMFLLSYTALLMDKVQSTQIVCKSSDSVGKKVCSRVVSYTIHTGYHKCGRRWNRKRCASYGTAYKYEYYCCNAAKTLAAACIQAQCISEWNSCPDGGVCVSHGCCPCNDQYYSSSHCTPCACTQINNCAKYYCTSFDSQQCRRCDYEHVAPYRAYIPIQSGSWANRICKQQCSWRPDSKQCYPGTCALNSTDSCQCAPGFESPASDCMHITAKPSIAHCRATVYQIDGGIELDSRETTCEELVNPTLYTNLKIGKLTVDWSSVFKGPSVVDWPLPYYADHPGFVKIGLASASVKWSIQRGSANIDTGTINCNKGHSRDNPNRDILHCDFSQTFHTEFQHGDKLHILPTSINGGYLRVKNYDNGPGTPTDDPKQYYNGATIQHKTSFTFDFEPPSHCSLLTSCKDNMLDIGPPYTKEATITIQWNGWNDPLSGIETFEYEIYLLRPFGHKLRSIEAIDKQNVTALTQTGQESYTLAKAGMYAVFLTVVDVAGNLQHARRFVLFDNISSIDISSHQDDIIKVDSAAKNTSYLWITSLDKMVLVSWKNHFYNELHNVNKLLNEIESHHVPIKQGYEERQGQPPLSRSMTGIPNINGIIKYEISYLIDHVGGRTITEMDESKWQLVSAFQNETENLVIPRQDGDSLRIWIKATDVMNNSAADEVLVHIDSSPALIQDMGLSRYGQVQLAVHSAMELYDTVFEFTSFDYHSGLKQVSWQLHDMENHTRIHGQGHLSVHKTHRNDTNCVPPNCYCIPKDDECFYKNFTLAPDRTLLDIPHGNHDFDYKYTLVVINNAMLVTEQSFQITIDISPPVPGFVIDGEPGQTDRDYQSSYDLHASWNGFFDRESGILLYKYGFHYRCISDKEFLDQNNSLIKSTAETFSKFNVMTSGKYFITVVAFNYGMEPSIPVCSDGVVVDNSAPFINNLFIENLHIKDGLIRDENDTVFYASKNVIVHTVELDNGTECRNKALQMDNVHVFKKMAIRYYDKRLLKCMDFDTAGSKMFLSSENMLNITWQGYDNESQILDYEVGLSTTSSGSTDILPYKSTQGHPRFLTYHTNLVNGLEFYINIKSINKANIEMSKIIGPIVVKPLPPIIPSSLNITLHHHNNEDYIVARLDENGYIPIEIADMFISKVLYAIGSNECNRYFTPFAPVTKEHINVLFCQVTDPVTCIAIKTTSLPFHLQNGTSYCVSVRFDGVNGLSSHTTGIMKFKADQKYTGFIQEINIMNGILVHGIDVDIQTYNSSVAYEYYGFPEGIYHNTVSLVGLGKSPGVQDIISLSVSANTEGSGKLDGLNLAPFKKYYLSVNVTDVARGISFLSTSDGFMVIPTEISISEMNVFIGNNCSSSHSYGLNTSMVHHSKIFLGCKYSIKYQLETTSLQVYWIISDLARDVITDIDIEVEELQTNVWHIVKVVGIKGSRKNHTITDLKLEDGIQYRVKLTACHESGCLKEVYSQSVTVISKKPLAQPILKAEISHDFRKVQVTWKAFLDPSKGFDMDIINAYEVSIHVKESNNDNSQYVLQWMYLDAIVVNTSLQQVSATVDLKQKLQPSKCFVLAIRGYNRVGLFTTSQTDLVGCSFDTLHKVHVLDATSVTSKDGQLRDIKLDSNDAWSHPDKEFTKSTTSIHAVWPSLRHEFYFWKIVSGNAVHKWAYFERTNGEPRYEDFHCTSPEVIACGETNDNYINVHHLTLKEGNRYHVCIQSNQTTRSYEYWKQVLPEVSECSDGIVVDTLPPVPGHVWIGYIDNPQVFQIGGNHLAIFWTSFLDTEIHKETGYHSAIAKYEVAVGSSPRGVDVQDFTRVSISNFVYLQYLRLLDGVTYYATVRGTDYVGLASMAVSKGITIDSTPPVLDQDKIITDGYYLSPLSALKITWQGAFYDQDSGIKYFTWCIGTNKGICNIIPKVTTTKTAVEVLNDKHFTDGHSYTFNIEAVNGAGLLSLYHISNILADTSVPVEGHVIEYVGAFAHDIDFSTDASSVNLLWSGFSDLHVPIKSYYVSVGEFPACTNLLNDVSVGLQLGLNLTGLSLKKGKLYCTTVKACSFADLCSNSTSDGIIIDSTPPHLGIILDGVSGMDIQYQSSRDSVMVHIDSMHDDESGIASLNWWAGTSQNGSDIFNKTVSPILTTLQMPKKNLLPLYKNIFTTVEICNKAGLCTQKSSNSFKVDVSPPVVIESIHIETDTSSLVQDTQVWLSALEVSWKMEDKESPIIDCTVTIKSGDNTHLESSRTKLSGNPDHHIFSNMIFSDGDEYKVHVLCCNAARLCSSSTSKRILIDGSPPSSGAFATDTTHAIDLLRHRRGWMTYFSPVQVTTPYTQTAGDTGTISSLPLSSEQKTESGTIDKLQPYINVSWVGFQDAHSNILKYYLKVGKYYQGCEFCNNGMEEVIQHSVDELHRDEGFIQTATVFINETIIDYEIIFIAVWAENGVGLNSSVLHGKFKAIPAGGETGSLELIRRCDTETCMGHCTCAPHGRHTCEQDQSAQCQDVTGNSQYSRIEISDTTFNTKKGNLDYGFERTTLSATWEAVDKDKQQPMWYEWSVSVKNKSAGTGLLNQHTQPVWFDCGQNSFAVFTQAMSHIPDLLLDSSETYTFQVKSWFDDTHYAIHSSDGIKVDAIPPLLSKSYKILDLPDVNTIIDVDFITSKSKVAFSWKNVFHDEHSNINRYILNIGSIHGINDVYNQSFGGNTFITEVNGITLEEGVHYYATVTSCNLAGLCSSSYSDGFKVDTSPPVAGTVRDGMGLIDIDFSSSTKVFSARWTGFYDDESFISYYTLCVGSSPGLADLLDSTNTGMKTWYQYELKKEVNTEDTVYARVEAVNGAGITSKYVTSNGITVDTTPPSPTNKLQLGENLVNNSLFDRHMGSVSEWITKGKIVNITTCKTCVCISHGYISQILDTKSLKKYRIFVKLSSNGNTNDNHLRTAFVQVSTLHQSIQLLPSTHSSTVQSVYYYFIGSSSQSVIQIGTTERKFPVCFHEVKVQELLDGSRNEIINVDHPHFSHKSPVLVHVAFARKRASLTASWNIEDPESPIIDYMVAVGTVKGGVQIQTFRSTGQHSHFHLSHFFVSHGSYIHVTVVATNAAGLKQAIYSDPMIVDLTEPQITQYKVNNGNMVCSTDIIPVVWKSEDTESNVESCYLSVGTSSEKHDFVTPQKVASSGSKEVQLDTKTLHGKEVNVNIQCTNFLGLMTKVTSVPIIISVQGPSIASANIRVIPVSETYYPVTGSTLSSGEMVWLYWSGVHDTLGIQNCQSVIHQDTNQITEWTTINNLEERILSLHDLKASQSNYTFGIKCTNIGNISSNVFKTNFVINDEAPIFLGGSPNMNWLSLKDVQINWDGMFNGSSLVYEVHIGTVIGSGDVVKWIETMKPSITVKEIDKTKEHYITITAINTAGLYTGKTFRLA